MDGTKRDFDLHQEDWEGMENGNSLETGECGI